MHRRAIQVFALQPAFVRADQAGYALEPVQGGERPGLASHENA